MGEVKDSHFLIKKKQLWNNKNQKCVDVEKPKTRKDIATGHTIKKRSKKLIYGNKEK
jgi:hypothetical protein